MIESAAPGEAPVIAAPQLDSLGTAALERMRVAALEVLECYRVLEKAELNVVGEVLRGHGTFLEYEHYPPDDVYDRETHAQYYYHSHRGAIGEHGHFHTFMRAKGMPEGVRPAPYAGDEEWPSGDDTLSHLIAIAMDAWGKPLGLFAANRWVTGDTWYAAEDVIRMLDRFVIDHAFPSWPVNRWISAMFVLYRPHIEALVRHRDTVLARWAADHPGTDAYEDRNLEITGQLPISVETELATIEELLAARRRGGSAGKPSQPLSRRTA